MQRTSSAFPFRIPQSPVGRCDERRSALTHRLKAPRGGSARRVGANASPADECPRWLYSRAGQRPSAHRAQPSALAASRSTFFSLPGPRLPLKGAQRLGRACVAACLEGGRGLLSNQSNASQSEKVPTNTRCARRGAQPQPDSFPEPRGRNPEMQLPNPLKVAPVQRFHPLEVCNLSLGCPQILFFPLVYPPGSGQRLARQTELIRWGPNSAKLFCMRKFKNRLAAKADPWPAARPKMHRIFTPYRALPTVTQCTVHWSSGRPPVFSAHHPLWWLRTLQRPSHRGLSAIIQASGGAVTAHIALNYRP